MADRLALKRLTRSDLTLFEAKYRTVKAGNQKAINLNADVFISDLYPAAPSIAPTTDNEIRLALSIFGPDAKGEDRMTRKIIKNPTYRNWRLNGEFISNPGGDPARYDALQPNDLAVMLFDGEPIPTSLKLCLISQSDPADLALYNELFRLLGNRSMIPISPEVLLGATSRAGTTPAHPIRGFANDPLVEAAIEDAALGGQSGIRTLRAHGRHLSAADLERARATASAIGRDGEGLINALFQAKIVNEEVTAAEWIADSNAISPYDFEITTSEIDKFKIDVKSTRGPFDNDIHISVAEIIEAATSADRYSIYRVYELNADGGKLRVAADIRELAKSILAGLSALPAGVNCDGFSVAVLSPGLVWGTETYVSRPDGDEDIEATEPPPAEAEQSVSLPVNSR